MWSRIVLTLLLVTITLASTLEKDPSTNKKQDVDESESDSENDEDYEDTSEEVIPPTSFTCDGKIDGFYADIETGCRVFHYCQTWNFPDESQETKDWPFRCPPTTIFRQQYLTCSSPHKSFRCEDSEDYYDVNEDIQGPVTPPPGSIPMPTTPSPPKPTRPPSTTLRPPKPPTNKPPQATTPRPTESTTLPTLPDYPEQEIEPTQKPPSTGSIPSIPSPPLPPWLPTLPQTEQFVLPAFDYRLGPLALPEVIPHGYIPLLPPAGKVAHTTDPLLPANFFSQPWTNIDKSIETGNKELKPLDNNKDFELFPVMGNKYDIPKEASGIKSGQSEFKLANPWAFESELLPYYRNIQFGYFPFNHILAFNPLVASPDLRKTKKDKDDKKEESEKSEPR